MATHDTSSGNTSPEALRALGVVLALTAVLALIAIAFALPAAKSRPHEVPIGAVGAPAASGQVADMLEHSAPGAFALTIYPNEAARRDSRSRRLRRRRGETRGPQAADRDRRQPHRRATADSVRQRHVPADRGA